MSFAEKEGTAHFEGDVTMNDGLRELYADTMAMNFTQGEKRDLRGVEAAGQVRLNWEGRKGFGDTFQWEAPDGKGFLIGRPARIAFQQGWLKGDNIYFRDNFNEVSVSGAAPSTASMQQKIPHPAPPGGTPSPAPQPKRTSTP
jgi:lipopolysaccharide export system protein LptA